MTRLAIVGVNVVLSAVLLAGLELASRAWHPVPFPDPFIAAGHEDWAETREYDPLLFWRMRPHATRDGQPLTNEIGLRGPSVPAKAPDEFRILSLGESTTFAGRLRSEESYSSLLGHALGRVDEKAVRVVNGGVPAYSIVQGLAYFEHRGLALRPDAIVLYFGYNDYLPIAARVARDASATDGVTRAITDRDLLAARLGLRARTTAFLQEHSNLVRWMSFRSIEEATVVASDRVRVPDADRWWALQEFRAICRDEGIRLVVMIPWYREFAAHEPLLRLLVSWPEVVLVDLPRGLPADRPPYFRDDVHPNAAGHRLIADHAAAEIRRAWASAAR